MRPSVANLLDAELENSTIKPKSAGKANLRVAHLTTVHPAFDVRIFRKECKSLLRAGYHVTLIACRDRDEEIEGIELRGLALRSNRISRMTQGVWSAFQKAALEDADLYHFHDPELIPVGLLLRAKGKKVIYDVHENLPADLAFKYYIPRPFRRTVASLIGAVEMLASRHFSAVIPATPSIGRRFDGRTRRVTVVSNYPILDESSSIETPWALRKSLVVYAGVLSRDRSAKEMVGGMACLPASMEATLILAGEFSPAKLGDEIEHVNGWNRVKALGLIGRSELAELFRSVRAGLLVYQPDANNLDAVPNKLFEYMDAGLPVIASDFPEFRRVVNEVQCGLLVDPLDPSAIARAIEYIFAHPAEAEEMGRRGRAAVRARYNWASEERKLLDLYAELLGSPCAE